MTVRVGILALDGCVGLSVFGPADLLNTANMIAEQSGRAGPLFETRIVSMGAEKILTSSGHSLLAEPLGEGSDRFDVIMVPGLGARSFAELEQALDRHRELPELLARFASEGAIIAATCTGTFFLGRSGLLNGKRATTTWWMADRFRSEFPEVELLDHELLVDEGAFVSSAAGASSLDLTLHLINRLAGPSLARLSARYLVVDGGRKSQGLYSVPWHSKTRDPLIEKADAWIRALEGHNASVAELASHLNLSERSLLRKFRKLTGTTPQAYIRNIRLDLSKQRLEVPRMSIAQIAADAGFSDENAFRKAFAQRTGITPAQYRKQFRHGGRVSPA